jgi:hypothetical protein
MNTMTVKLLLTWDIITGREQEYFEFVVREFIPQLQQLGLEPSDAWFTMYGDQPQITAEVQAADLPAMQRILKTAEWSSLVNRLQDYVENYTTKIVPARSGLQL